MLTREQNDILTQVCADRPMGKLMRQHWTPVCLSEELQEHDGTPVLIEVLGERFVAFRDSKGRIGVLDELCPHRRASLLLGRNEDCGLRCLYHGWKFDVDGNTTSMVSEPEDSSLMAKVKQPAYPTTEWGGFIWAWFGGLDRMPDFQPPAFAPTKNINIAILKIRIPANWAQIVEGQIDSAHSSSLHSSDMVPARVPGATADEKSWYRPSTDKAPKLQVESTPYGFHYAAIRKPITASAENNYVRVTKYIAPYTSLIPPNSSYNVACVIVPIDDENSFFYFMAWGTEAVPDTRTWREFTHAVPGIDLDANWAPKRNADNMYQQDRDKMKAGNFTGIEGIPNQDIAMWVSMGAITDRTRETLGASDISIVEFRRRMIDAAIAVENGEKAIGTDRSDVVHSDIAAFEGIVSKELDWRELATGVSANTMAK